jgi:hypothetical protein
MAGEDPIPTPAPAPAPVPEPTPTPGPIPYARFQEVNQRLQEATARLAELGQQQQANTALEQRLATLEAERNQERTARQRLEIATKKGLPADLVPRLQGDTPEALEADADVLLAILGSSVTKSPGVPPSGGASGRGQPFKLEGKSAAEIRDARAKGLI